MQPVEQLNSQFGIDQVLAFEQTPDDFILIHVDNAVSSAKISLYGGQILSFKRHQDAQDLLFVSRRAVYEEGQAIRGGVPVCWPWFGQDKSRLDLPSHGFARNQNWQVQATQVLPNGDTSVTLLLVDNEQTRAMWPYQFHLTLQFIIGEQLSLHLNTHNVGSSSFRLTQGLHTYFAICDIEQVTLRGLEQLNYLDKLEDYQEKQQLDTLLINDEVDRVYLDTPNQVFLQDEGNQRIINIQSSGCKTTVVWNPWTKTAEALGDLKAKHHRRFICVEAVNTADDVVVLQPDQQHRLSASYSIEPLA